jgi:hypothetical protein
MKLIALRPDSRHPRSLGPENRAFITKWLLQEAEHAVASTCPPPHGWVAKSKFWAHNPGCESTMRNKGKTGSPSTADADGESWEPCTLREEIGTTAFYVAERVCYRVALLLSGVCNRRVLDAADYWRARRERSGQVRHGLREDGPPSGEQ